MRYFITVICFIAIFAYSQLAPTDAVANEVEVPKPAPLFSCSAGDPGSTFVVLRGPDIDVAALASLRPNVLPELKGKQVFYQIKAQVSPAGAVPVVIASRIRVEDGTKNDRGIVVLDAMLEPGKATILTGEGPQIYIWEIGIGLPTRWIPFEVDKPWSLNAAATAITAERVEGRLHRNLDGRLSVEINYKGHGDYRTSYLEDGVGSLNFKSTTR